VVELTSESQLLGIFLLGGHCIAGYSSGFGVNRVEFESFQLQTAGRISSCVLGIRWELTETDQEQQQIGDFCK
jgi:hypothetical protein